MHVFLSSVFQLLTLNSQPSTSAVLFVHQSTDLPCTAPEARSARPLPSQVPFGLNAFEQFGVRSIQVVSEFHRCLQSLRVHLKTFSQFPGSRVVKEGNVLIQIRHD